MKFVIAVFFVAIFAVVGYVYGQHFSLPFSLGLQEKRIVNDTRPSKEKMQEFHTQVLPDFFSSKLSQDEFANYSQELRALVLKDDPHQAFDQLRSLIDEKKVRKDCNNLTYQIGLAIYEKYQNVEEAVPHAEKLCGYGGFHGILGAYFKKSRQPFEEMKSFCRTYPEKRSEMECYHAVGHAMMELTHGDMQQSVAMCQSFLSENAQAVCARGIFHEYFQPHEEQYVQVFPTARSILDACEKQEGVYRTACYKLAPRAYIATSNQMNGDVLQWCGALVDKEDRIACTRGVAGEAMQYVYNPSQLELFCFTGTGEQVEPCIAEIVYNKLQYTEKNEMRTLCKEGFSYLSTQEMCLEAVERESRI